MSIGGTLAEARREAGLTITAVSQRTCIRETIIRSIEQDDFSGCGGDFYARGHIRSIAGVAGVDPQPLIDEYDATMGAPPLISAAEVFQPVVPVKLRERRKPNWTVALAIVVVLVGGAFAYQRYAGRSQPPAPRQAAKTTARTGLQARSQVQAKSQSAHAAQPGPRLLDISLTAAQNCYVQLISATGQVIYRGEVHAGRSAHWTERRAVTMTIANPAAIRLRVNGRNPIPVGAVRTMTLRLHPAREAS